MKKIKLFVYFILITFLTSAIVCIITSCDSKTEPEEADSSDNSVNSVQTAIDKIDTLFYNTELIEKAAAHEDFSETEFFKNSAFSIANIRGFFRSSMPDSEVQEQIAKDIVEAIDDLEEYFKKQAEADVLEKLRQNSCEKFNSALNNMHDEIYRINSEK